MSLPRFVHGPALPANAPIPYPDGYTVSVLATVRTVALVGISVKEDRPSHHVMAFLQSRGIRVFPVNPGLAGQSVLGETVYASLADIPADIDMVDIFRNAEAAAGIVDETLARNAALPDDRKARIVWMQLGVRHDDAAHRAEATGLTVIMDRCPIIEWGRGSSGQG